MRRSLLINAKNCGVDYLLVCYPLIRTLKGQWLQAGLCMVSFCFLTQETLLDTVCPPTCINRCQENAITLDKTS